MKRWLMAAVVGVAAGGAGAETYFVAPDGANANSGDSGHPWATPGHGSRQLAPGDTLVIRAGRYVISRYDEDIMLPPSGSAGNWITIRGEAGTRPVIAGRDNLFSAVILDGVSYLRIENLEITHDAQAEGEAAYFRSGIVASGQPCSHIVLSDLFIHHLDEGALDARDVDDLQVLGCRFEYCGFGGIGGPEGRAGGLRNLVVRGCSLSYSGHYYQGGDGSTRPYDRPDGFGIEPSAGPILIEDTRAEHNFGDGLDSKAANTTIRRCVVANNTCDGVKLWGTGSRVENTLIYGLGDGVAESYPWGAIVIGTTQAGASFELVNVTIDDELGNPGYIQIDSAAPIGMLLRNCIINSAGGSAFDIGPSVNLTADHLLFHFPNRDDFLRARGESFTAATVATLGQAVRHADPRFVRPAWGQEGDYQLLADSPAIDAGTANGAPADDLARQARDARPDLGAYEYRGATPTPRPRLRGRLRSTSGP
ncbi:MAG: right-handed parallel beta-helix repeat-containing protein [Acidobacteriota bacterium]